MDSGTSFLTLILDRAQNFTGDNFLIRNATLTSVFETLATYKCLDFSNWSTVFGWLLLLLFAYVYYVTCVKLMDEVKPLDDVGYATEPLENRKVMAQLIQGIRKVGECPPVYPNGWFAIIEGHRLHRLEAKSIIALGKSLAVFRDSCGTAHILDAYCPHLGANIAVGGRVIGDTLQCPFHGWQFRGEDGQCTKIPYIEGEKIPDGARVKSYISKEVNGWLYLWFDAEGRQPYWEIPEIDEISRGAWTFRGRTEHMVNSVMQDMPENGADMSHLPIVHVASVLAGVDLRHIVNKLWSFSEHSWEAKWLPMTAEGEKHIGEMQLKHSYKLFGFRFPLLDVKVTARQVGPAIVYMFTESIFGRGMFHHNVTPVEPRLQRLVHGIYCNWFTPNFIAYMFLKAEMTQIERDIMIWNNKCYQRQPVFVKSKEDSLIAQHRRWYNQFYSGHSPRLTMKEPDSLSW